MPRKSKYKLSDKQRKNKNNMLTTPLKKVDDIPDVDKIINSDDMLIKVGFVSNLMVRHHTVDQMRKEYEAEFGEPISYGKMNKLRHATKLIYLSQIAKDRDILVAEELMQADWELRELMEAWDKSKEGALKKSKHTAKSVGTEMTTYDLDEETENTERSFGDIRYMEQIGKVRQRIINVLGLEAPKQQPQQQNTGAAAVTINVVGKPQNIDISEAQVVK